jgi:hypothetical protein
MYSFTLKITIMKKLFTLLFSVGLVTAVFAQSGDRHRNDSRSNDNRDPSSPYSNNNNNQSGYPGQYSKEDSYDGNPQWNERGNDNQFARSRERQARQRYEMMMMRSRERYNHQRRHDNYSPYAPAGKAVLQIRIGIGNRSMY